MPVLSIVIPVYNVERYVSACLYSARHQTLDDIEIICVNDGSPDRSRNIVALHAQLDPRVKVVDQPNKGLSSARNTGIRQATGAYVCFLDSDDLLERDAAQVIVDAFETSHADIVTYGAHVYPKRYGNQWMEDVLSPRDVEYDGFDPALLFEESSHPYAWRTACRTVFLKDKGLFFDEGLKFGEDQLFHFAIYPRAGKTALISDKLLKYRVARPDSLMAIRRAKVKLRVADHLNIASHIIDDWRAGGFMEAYSKDLFFWICSFLLHDIVCMPILFRKAYAYELSELLAPCYTKEELSSLATETPFEPLIDAVLLNPTRLEEKPCHAARAEFYRRENGLKDSLSFRIQGTLLHRAYTKMRGLLSKTLPFSRRKARIILDDALDELQWNQVEQDELSSSLSLLYAEALSQLPSI